MRIAISLRFALAAFIALAAPAAWCAEDSIEAGRVKANAFLETLKGYDESLESVTWFGMYLNGRKNIGVMRFEVGRAPEGSGGVYHVNMMGRLNVPGASMFLKEELVLDKRFSIVSSVSSNENQEGRTERSIARDGTDWKLTMVRKTTTAVIFQVNINYPNDQIIVWKDVERTQRAFLADPGSPVKILEKVDGMKQGTPHVMYRIEDEQGRTGWVPKPWIKEKDEETTGVYRVKAGEGGCFDNTSMMLVGRKLLAGSEGLFVFPGVKWPDDDELSAGEKRLGDEARIDVSLTAAGYAQHEHRGKTMQARQMVADDSDEEKMIIILDRAGKLLELQPEGLPFCMIAGEEDECVADLSGAPESADKKAVRAALITLFKVQAGVESSDRLDEVFDWGAFRASLAVQNPGLANLDDESFATAFKAQMEGQKSTMKKEFLEFAGAILDIKIKGDEATASVPKESTKFHLRKIEGKWKIVGMEQ